MREPIDIMINVGLYYKVKPGHEAEFEDIFSGVVEQLKGSASGIKDAKLYRRVGDEPEYMIYTEWESMESFKKFVQSSEFHSTTQKGRDIIDGMPKHRVFREETA
jgi:heme-degrading monooxygenase HmoA